jgi:hypothetical protein
MNGIPQPGDSMSHDGEDFKPSVPRSEDGQTLHAKLDVAVLPIFQRDH